MKFKDWGWSYPKAHSYIYLAVDAGCWLELAGAVGKNAHTEASLYILTIW